MVVLDFLFVVFFLYTNLGEHPTSWQFYFVVLFTWFIVCQDEFANLNNFINLIASLATTK